MSRSLPLWLLDSKQEITQSHQWPSFLQDLSDALNQQLRESRKNNLTSLTDPERALFIERATQAIKKGQTYAALHKKISSTLDRQLNNEVQRQILEDLQGSESRTDLILGTAQDGIIGLLNKWPNLRSKLHVCFNQALSEAMRPAVWRLCLRNEAAGKRFQRILTENPDSVHKVAVAEKGREIFNTEGLLASLKTSKGAHHAMKTVLSYHYSYESRTEGATHTNFYKLIIPFILVNSASLPRKELATVQVMTHILEEYLTFLYSLPTFVLDPVHQDEDDKFRVFVSRVAHHLRQMNPVTARTISSAYFKSEAGHVVSTAGYEGESEVAERETLIKALAVLSRPLVHNMLVGYVSRDVLLYVWDQYIIGLSSPGFCDEYLPAVIALFLHSLSDDKMKKCNSLQQIESHLKTEGPRLTVSLIQSEIGKHFYSELLQRLKGSDASEGQQPPEDSLGGYAWQGWFSAQMAPAYTEAVEDRRTVREEREIEQKRVTQAQLNQQRRLNDERHRAEDEEMKREKAQERRQYQITTDKYKQEIEQLKRTVRDLEQQNKKGVVSGSTVVAPVNSSGRMMTRSSYGTLPALERVENELGVVAPTRKPPPTGSGPSQDLPVEDQSRDAISDFISRMAFSFGKIANGDGIDRDRLDRETLESIEVHRKDIREAEVEVMGRQLKPGEFEEMPESVRLEKTENIMEVIQARVQERYKERYTEREQA